LADTVTDNPLVECTVFPKTNQIVFINNSNKKQEASCTFAGKKYFVALAPYVMKLGEL
jgi:hypothetical protein